MSLVSAAFGDDWPQWRGPTRDGVWHESGIVGKFSQPQIKLLWRTPISNGYSGPTMANGRVYVTDRLEKPVESERVLCLDARTGKMPWFKEYACSYIYGVDSYGQFRCLEAATGDRVWEDLTLVPVERWANIHMVRNSDKVWMFNESGELLITKLSRTGVEVISRAKLIEPTKGQLGMRQGVCWSHPAYAGKCIFARNDNEIVCASLAAQSEENPALSTDLRKAD